MWTRRLIDKSHNAGLAVRLGQLLCLERSRLPGAEPDVADHDKNGGVVAPHDPVAVLIVDGFQGPIL
jgi:hypothetical protein